MDVQNPVPGSQKRTALTRRRVRGQSIVEFGLIALTFTLLLMGIVDFAILLNGWLGVSSSARDIARQAAVGLCPPASPNNYLPGAPGGTCIASIPKLPTPLSLNIQGVDHTASPPVSVTLQVYSSDMSSGPFTGANLTNIYPGGSCDPGTTNCAHPVANDSIVISVTAQIQVVTPLVRPFFGCTNGSVACRVPVTSRTVLRYEGVFI
jgi:hypothetical protein